MKHRFASLTLVGMAAASVLAAPTNMEARGQESGVPSTLLGARPNRENAPINSGQQLVAEAAKRVSAEPAISAEMRYKIDAFGHELVGSGSYLQFGPGPEKLLRLDLKMQVGQRLATVQEIRGSDSYWIRRDVPPGPPSLGRVDLKQLRKSLSPSPIGGDGVLPQGDWLMLGGLARLLTALEHNFAFDAPQAEELQFDAADGKSRLRLPIWIVNGRWKPERYGALAGEQPKKATSPLLQLPDRVDLVLGRADGALSLFPYRITYWQDASARAKAASDAPAAAPRELLTLELFNVSRKPIDPREFDYQPGDQDVQNLTQFYVQRFSAETKLR